MNTQNRLFGIGLIVLGILFLLGNVFPYFDFGGLMLMTVGGAFIIGFNRRRELGFLIAGCLILALGLFVVMEPLVDRLDVSGPAFFALMALGFLAIYVFGTRPLVWPLIVAAILGGFSVFVFMVENRYTSARVIFPVFLIALGAYLLTGRGRSRQ